MVSCGAQSSVPVSYCLTKILKIKLIILKLFYNLFKVRASNRLNLDEYIYQTQKTEYFSGIKNAKAILNLNPAIPV